MKNNSIKFEYESRHCPICGKFVEIEPPTHRCLEKDLKELDKELDKELKLDRTYDDRLNEFNNFYNNENYYDNDIEEE